MTTATTIDPAATLKLGLTRAFVPDAVSLRDADGDEPGDGRTLAGHFATFNSITEIDNWYEGNFREQILPGAFDVTFRERASQIRCIYGHGRDALFGSKPIGDPRVLREDDTGAYYETALYHNADIDSWIIPAARGGQLGSSFAFDVLGESWELEPDDGGLPIRSISEVRLYEYGPTPFPAYADATAGIRAVERSWHTLPAERQAQLTAALTNISIPDLDAGESGRATDDQAAGSDSDTDPLGDPGAVALIQSQARQRKLALLGLTT